MVVDIKKINFELESIRKLNREIKFKCERCDDTGWIVYEKNNRDHARRCKCNEEQRREFYMKYLENVFGEHNIKKLNKNQVVVRDIAKAERKKGLWIYGKGGTGKSAYMFYILKDYEKKIYCRKGKNAASIFREQSLEGKYIEKKWKLEIRKYSLFAIDDIDKLWPYTDSVKNHLFDFIDEIISKKKIIMISSNNSIENFCSCFSGNICDPLQRRLKAYCAEIKM